MAAAVTCSLRSSPVGIGGTGGGGADRFVFLPFQSAKLDVTIKDRSGQPVTVREWFLVPLSVIDELVEKVIDGTVGGRRHGTPARRLVPAHDRRRAETPRALAKS